MASWADPNERFVEIPGIVEIRWVSDDPDYYVAPIDLFDEQKKGLPDFYGKKDKTTTEQAFFTCNVCECDLKSVVTLRAHCKGTQHIRKSLQKKKEWRRQNVKNEPKLEVKTDTFRSLFDWLDQGTSEAVVGLEHITEYQSGRERDEPYYHCSLEHCKDEQGGAEMMKNHMLTARHKQAWLEKKTGSFLKHQTEISQRIAEFTKDFRRDFRDMKVVEDREMWWKAKEGRIRVERTEDIRVKTERFERKESSSHTESIKTYRKEYEERGEPSKMERRQGYGRERGEEIIRDKYQDQRREGSYEHYLDRKYSRTKAYIEKNCEDNARSDSKGRYRRSEYVRGIQEDYRRSRSRSPVERHARGWDYQRGIKSEYRDIEEHNYRNNQEDLARNNLRSNDDVEEVSRSGNFDNWRTATVKVDSAPDPDPSVASTSSKDKDVIATFSKERSVSEDVDRLHRKVANKVMKSLNKYYPGAEEFDPSQHKIGSPEEYSRLAKQLSHQLRRKIKESYEAYHSTLEGIQLTGDHEQFIRTEVECYFESVQRIR